MNGLRALDRSTGAGLRQSAGAVCLLLLLASLASGCAPEATPADTVILRGQTMGTTYAVTLAPSAEVDAEALKREIDIVLERVNDQMSTYRPDSELSRFNRGPAGDWFPVSAETASVAAEARELAAKSEGAFDPTVGTLVDLWGFGPEARPETIPDAAQIAAAKARVGWAQFDVRTDPPALSKELDGLRVDLSAIAKGHGVDEVARLLLDRGHADFLVDIGGDMRAGGEKAPGVPWTIAVERPVAEGRQIERALGLSDTAIATSGDYRNYFEQDGKRYSHTIDPRTGRPIDHRLASVTVLEDTCTTADGLATLLMVLGEDEGYTFSEEHGIPALFLVRTPAGFEAVASPEFAARYPEND